MSLLTFHHTGLLVKDIKVTGIVIVPLKSYTLGGISNLIERLLYGYVCDYIHFFTWFNLNDLIITFSLLILIFISLKDHET